MLCICQHACWPFLVRTVLVLLVLIWPAGESWNSLFCYYYYYYSIHTYITVQQRQKYQKCNSNFTRSPRIMIKDLVYALTWHFLPIYALPIWQYYENQNSLRAQLHFCFTGNVFAVYVPATCNGRTDRQQTDDLTKPWPLPCTSTSTTHTFVTVRLSTVPTW